MTSLIISVSLIAGLLALELNSISQNSNCKTFMNKVMNLTDNTLTFSIYLLNKKNIK